MKRRIVLYCLAINLLEVHSFAQSNLSASARVAFQHTPGADLSGTRPFGLLTANKMGDRLWSVSLLAPKMRPSGIITPQEPRKRLDLNGMLLKEANGDAVFLIDGGQRRWVPTEYTFNKLFRDWSRVKEYVDLNIIEKGRMIPTRAALVMNDEPGCEYRGYVFLTDDPGDIEDDSSPRILRHVTSERVMDKYWFN